MEAHFVELSIEKDAARCSALEAHGASRTFPGREEFFPRYTPPEKTIRFRFAVRGEIL